jgi:hypothetical protein
MPSSASSTLLARAREDDNVVGVVLHGSRARGLYVTEQSDLDAIFVVRELRGAYPSRHGDPVEVVEVTSLERLPGWMLAALTWTEPTLDKTGEVAEQLRTVTAVDPATAGEPLDGYINMYYRLEWELREHPLPVAVDLARLRHIATTGDLGAQQALFRDVELIARTHGLGETVDGWEPDVAWLRGL